MVVAMVQVILLVYIIETNSLFCDICRGLLDCGVNEGAWYQQKALKQCVCTKQVSLCLIAGVRDIEFQIFYRTRN